MEHFKKTLRSVLISNKDGFNIGQLQTEYRAITAEVIPFREFGYHNCIHLLESDEMNDVVRCVKNTRYDTYYFAVVTEETSHVARLVNRTGAKKKTNNKWTPTPNPLPPVTHRHRAPIHLPTPTNTNVRAPGPCYPAPNHTFSPVSAPGPPSTQPEISLNGHIVSVGHPTGMVVLEASDARHSLPFNQSAVEGGWSMAKIRVGLPVQIKVDISFTHCASVKLLSEPGTEKWAEGDVKDANERTLFAKSTMVGTTKVPFSRFTFFTRTDAFHHARGFQKDMQNEKVHFEVVRNFPNSKPPIVAISAHRAAECSILRARGSINCPLTGAEKSQSSAASFTSAASTSSISTRASVVSTSTAIKDTTKITTVDHMAVCKYCRAQNKVVDSLSKLFLKKIIKNVPVSIEVLQYGGQDDLTDTTSHSETGSFTSATSTIVGTSYDDDVIQYNDDEFVKPGSCSADSAYASMATQSIGSRVY